MREGIRERRGRSEKEEGKKKETRKKVLCERDGERKIDSEKNHNVGASMRKTWREGGGGFRRGTPVAG